MVSIAAAGDWLRHDARNDALLDTLKDKRCDMAHYRAALPLFVIESPEERVHHVFHEHVGSAQATFTRAKARMRDYDHYRVTRKDVLPEAEKPSTTTPLLDQKIAAGELAYRRASKEKLLTGGFQDRMQIVLECFPDPSPKRDEYLLALKGAGA
jgi:hypothetical protein